jgi:hypothetical protein
MTELEAIDDIFIFEGKRGSVYLEPTNGKVIPYGINEIPPTFKIPLKKSSTVTSIRGVASGDRTALMSSQNKRYKLKGIIPSNNGYEEEDVPYGCLKETACLRELNAAQVMTDFGLKKRIPSPLKPVGHFQYETFFQDEHVSCCVEEVKGDDRLEECHGKFLSTLEEAFRRGYRDKEKISEVREQFTNRIGNWVGFWCGALEKANLCWGSIFYHPVSPQTNVGSHNIVLYPVDRGVGVGLVDLDKSHKDPSEKVRNWELDHIRKELSLYDGMLHFLENGTKAEAIRNYFIHQLAASINLPAFRKGFDPFYGVSPPEEGEMEIIKCFEEGRKGVKPLPIEKDFFTNPEEKIIGILK